ncbi:hypothetical protein [Rhodopseudomonas palustris]|uniref:hypothetical protein n=1 Tax=Rhodopseudomonas palustris TaxID=1076 RepID=UPI000164B9AD|nr:hypothetical protein [Rhodopseudomonas palustris]
MAESAGFRFVAASEINANPKDAANWPTGVWTPPPTFTLGDTDREQYAAIVEADNFVLKFQARPGDSLLRSPCSGERHAATAWQHTDVDINDRHCRSRRRLHDQGHPRS